MFVGFVEAIYKRIVFLPVVLKVVNVGAIEFPPNGQIGGLHFFQDIHRPKAAHHF